MPGYQKLTTCNIYTSFLMSHLDDNIIKYFTYFYCFLLVHQALSRSSNTRQFIDTYMKLEFRKMKGLQESASIQPLFCKNTTTTN